MSFQELELICSLSLSLLNPQFLRVPLAKQPCERLIVSPRRQIILEGALNLLDSGKPVEMYLILFDDMFVITRRKKGLSKKVREEKGGGEIE